MTAISAHEEVFEIAETAATSSAHSSAAAVAEIAKETPAAAASEPAAEPVSLRGYSSRFSYEPEIAATPARPRFAELAEVPSYAPLPRDYATEMPATTTGTSAIFDRSVEPEQTDLDVPAFLRRGQF